MIKIQGIPKSSALFFWTDNSSEKGKMYYASFFTISPVEMDMSDLPFQNEGVSFTFPIMVHEPLPCSNIEKIISDARERNAAIVDCGRTTIKSIRARMKKALGEYLQALIANYIEMEQKQFDMAEKNIVDIDFENLKKKIKKTNLEDRVKNLFILVAKIREELNDKMDRELIERDIIKLNKYRPETEADFDEFIDAVGRKGKISDKIIELYKIKQQAELEDMPEENKMADNDEELASLFILNRLDSLREQVRKQLGNANSAISTLENIYRIKNLNPSFCSREDLGKFCNIATERGIQAGNISKKYIEKYFMVITKRFKEAGSIHKQIQEAEANYFNSKK